MAMKAHAPFLELAAAAVDFDLSPDEQAELDAHVETCTACRRAVTALRADAVSIAQLPHRAMSEERAARMAAELRRGRARSRTVLPSMRTALLVGLLALLAIGAVTVGSALFLRDTELDLTVVPPTLPSPDATTRETPGPSPSPTTSPSPPTPSPTPPGDGVFADGMLLEVVVAGLRVRTAPTSDNARSSALQPSLDRGARLEVLEGPEESDGYTWYEVQAIGWPHQGWVATSDLDGEPWVVPFPAASPAALTAAQEALVTGLRADDPYTCATPVEGLPAGARAGIGCHIHERFVTRIYAYAYDDPQAAAEAYRDHLARYDVPTGGGDCAGDEPGDASWGVGDEAADARIGCYRDENGFAHVRLTCGSTYIAVLSAERQIPDVLRWVWGTALEAPEGTPPALCRSN